MATQGEFFERPDTTIIPNAALVAEEIPSMPVAENGVKQHSSKPSPRRAMKDLSIPKLYYSISEVSRLTALEPYVLRYWETEFPELRPQKNRAGNRIYSNRDIKFILRIKELLREQRYTIEGAKVILKGERFAEAKPVEEAEDDPAQILLDAKPAAPQATVSLEDIRSIKQSLLDLRAIFAGAAK